MTRTSSSLLELFASPCSESLAGLGESPPWEPYAGLRWLDVPDRRLFTLHLDGRGSSVALSRMVTAIELGPGGDLLAVTRAGFGLLDPATGCVDEIVHVVHGETISTNDGAIESDGRCWAGSAEHDQTYRGVLLLRRQHRHHAVPTARHIEWPGLVGKR